MAYVGQRANARNYRERKEKELAKIKSYNALSDRVLAKKHFGDYSIEALDLTTDLLAINPEFYTIWNYRRHIFLNGVFPKSNPAEIHARLKDDLEFTLRALKQHPKVYWIWNHRRWCLEHIPVAHDARPEAQGGAERDGLDWQRQSWARELFVVEKMMDADPRNFHAWNYRRYVLASLPPDPPSGDSPSSGPSLALHRTPASELAFTTKKIEANFSNFSAWHQRSKVYAATGQMADASIRDAGQLNSPLFLDLNSSFVNQAMYTDPNDQSAWIYHRWLISQNPDPAVIHREIQIIQDLLAEEPDSKWCLESLEDGSVKTEVTKILQRLIDIDPKRKERYHDLGLELATATTATTTNQHLST
ncbi:hypothetical protein BS47DRAFT_1370925 [Hydnum rufescens UP504]|uniref:Geranylgeranyl transferase type-2 subunit alpha n=1 Tax=Hydnum rufescens UP504 TaxID=1448309 RepID=A0A9P6E1Q8_9AGAM|nr:hypothetical protein BS47DRAFT_1370925 [Hydnum rufescens UP504]